MMFALVTSISVVSLVFSTETVTQQPHGISTNVVIDTLKKSPIAAGVTIAVAFPSASPLIVSATEIGSTVPPVAIAIFPSKVTR